MTDYRGIAVVTHTLRQIAERALRTQVPGSTVTLARPEERAGEQLHNPRLNIYLVQVTVDPTLRHNDLPTRNSNGHLLSVPEIPLLLRYLFSYFGPEEKAQMMLGAVEIALHQTPELGPGDIIEAVGKQPDLEGSSLDTQQPPVRIVPVPMPLEELARFWSGFFNAPYTLSTVWDASAVILSQPRSTLAAGAPARGPSIGTGPMPPSLDSFATPVSYTDGARVRVSGRGLKAGQYIGIGDAWSVIQADADGDLEFALPPTIAAGTTTVRVGDTSRTSAPAPIPGATGRELVIRPQLRSVRSVPGHPAVRAHVRPPIRAGQQVALSLINDAKTGPNAGSSVRLAAAAATEAGTSIDFPLPAGKDPPLPAGRYLATIEVDGSTSLPIYKGGEYTGPMVKIR
jgi:hypothetical protein